MATLSAPTIEDMITNVRYTLNQPSSTNSFWTDAELTTYLNEGVRRCYNEIIQNGEGHFATTTTLNIVADTETIALPSDCFEVKHVWRTITNGFAHLSYRNNLSEGHATNGGSGGDTYLPDYYFRANNLVLSPTPNFSQTGGLKIEYIQFPAVMVALDSMTTQLSPIFKDVVEAYAVYKAKLKESHTSGVNTAALAQQTLNDLFTSMKETVTGRSMAPTAIIPFNPEDY